jgi:hypothetical protein
MKKMPQIKNAEIIASAEKGKLLLEIKVNRLSVNSSRWWRRAYKLGLLFGIFFIMPAAYLAWEFLKEIYELPEWPHTVFMSIVTGGVGLGMFTVFIERTTFKFYERGLVIETGDENDGDNDDDDDDDNKKDDKENKAFHPWKDFKGYKKESGECILIRENSKGIWKGLGSKNFYFPDKQGKIRSIVGRYLQRMR